MIQFVLFLNIIEYGCRCVIFFGGANHASSSQAPGVNGSIVLLAVCLIGFKLSLTENGLKR
jgi:hypothetical protein